MELGFLLVSQRGYSLNYSLWCSGVVKYNYWYMVLLIFAPQVYANIECLNTTEELVTSFSMSYTWNVPLFGRKSLNRKWLAIMHVSFLVEYKPCMI